MFLRQYANLNINYLHLTQKILNINRTEQQVNLEIKLDYPVASDIYLLLGYEYCINNPDRKFLKFENSCLDDETLDFNSTKFLNFLRNSANFLNFESSSNQVNFSIEDEFLPDTILPETQPDLNFINFITPEFQVSLPKILKISKNQTISNLTFNLNQVLRPKSLKKESFIVKIRNFTIYGNSDDDDSSQILPLLEIDTINNSTHVTINNNVQPFLIIVPPESSKSLTLDVNSQSLDQSSISRSSSTSSSSTQNTSQFNNAKNSTTNTPNAPQVKRKEYASHKSESHRSGFNLKERSNSLKSQLDLSSILNEVIDEVNENAISTRLRLDRPSPLLILQSEKYVNFKTNLSEEDLKNHVSINKVNICPSFYLTEPTSGPEKTDQTSSLTSSNILTNSTTQINESQQVNSGRIEISSAQFPQKNIKSNIEIKYTDADHNMIILDKFTVILNHKPVLISLDQSIASQLNNKIKRSDGSLSLPIIYKIFDENLLQYKNVTKKSGWSEGCCHHLAAEISL